MLCLLGCGSGSGRILCLCAISSLDSIGSGSYSRVCETFDPTDLQPFTDAMKSLK